MNLQRVTITGADDSVSPDLLLDFSAAFPFVEWGILVGFNAGKNGCNRFPSMQWIDILLGLMRRPSAPPVNLSLHVCGRWVKQICMGQWHGLVGEHLHIFNLAQRVQLNLGQENHDVDRDAFLFALQRVAANKQVIFQLNGNDLSLFNLARLNVANPTCVGLFDLSGGKGILPVEWPRPHFFPCGYAGGLSPENLNDQLPKIAAAAGITPIWIDCETHVRTEGHFDLNRVNAFLSKAKDWVTV